MSRARREDGDRVLRGHGDLGYIGERKKDTNAYGNNEEGNAVDRLLRSDDCVPSFIETVQYAMKKNERNEDITRGDMPRGEGAKQSGPYFGDVHGKDGTQSREAYARGGHVKPKHERHEKKEEHKMHHKGHKMMAMGGVGKERKGQY